MIAIAAGKAGGLAFSNSSILALSPSTFFEFFFTEGSHQIGLAHICRKQDLIRLSLLGFGSLTGLGSQGQL